MIMDRELQRMMLEKLAAASPYHYDFSSDYVHGTDEYQHALANLNYLAMHNLVEDAIIFSSGLGGERDAQFNAATITAKGLDFLEQDGGLSAILNTVTVKFHDDQLKQILAQHINQSDLPIAHKQLLLDELSKLPAESIKHLVNLLLLDGYQNSGAIVGIIQSFFCKLF